MNNLNLFALFPALFLSLFLVSGCGESEKKVIKIGFNLSLSGKYFRAGEVSKAAAELLREEVNSSGGLRIGIDRYKLEFVYRDNESDSERAAQIVHEFVAKEQVMAIVGPSSSTLAVPVGRVCNSSRIPMISPASTNPLTTKDRPWVFRVAFLDSFQGPVAVAFSIKSFGAQRSAVLFNKGSEYSAGLAEVFRDEWYKRFGGTSVVAFEGHSSSEKDFSSHIDAVLAAQPDILFVPDSYEQSALIVKQVRKKGWNGPIMGADGWGSSKLVSLCGKDCTGLFFSTHYVAFGATGETRVFIDKYLQKYGEIPDDIAALAWDASQLLLSAFSAVGEVAPRVQKQRWLVREALAKTEQFTGVTGKMRFDAQGDPIKCAVIVQIGKNGQFMFSESICP